MATSYINERTAEYYLVPALKRILEKDFYDVAPVFPWLSREFSKISKELHNSDKFSLLAMFPRRPKVGPDECRTIYAIINSELEEFCEVCEQYDVPVIAGCSNASTFWNLSRGDDVVWLDIRHPGLDSYLNPISHSAARLREQDVRAQPFAGHRVLRGTRQVGPGIGASPDVWLAIQASVLFDEGGALTRG